MPQLNSYIQTWEQEHRTTLRVFESFPEDRLEYRPHEKSRSARELMWTIASEEVEFVEGCLKGKIVFRIDKPPKTRAALVRAYKKSHAAMVKKVRSAGEDIFHRTIQFYVAPGKLGDVKVGGLLWEVLHDQIHHRGQLSVYLRLVGAKVPSIYGPSGDEPW